MKVLVPTTGAAAAAELVSIAGDLVAATGGQGTVLSVVVVPPDRSLSEGAILARRRRTLLRKLSHVHPDLEMRAEVRTARSFPDGVRAAMDEGDCTLMLLGWHPNRRAGAGEALEPLLDAPPCDLALVKAGETAGIRRVLLPVRGGPHAALALRMAEAIAGQNNAVLTLLHIALSGWDMQRRAREHRYFEEVRRNVAYPNTEQVGIESDAVEPTLLAQAARHDLVIMGAAARDENSPYLMGRIPERVARSLDCTVVVVKTREPVTAGTFHGQERDGGAGSDISLVVDRWFAENTFHSHEFRQIHYLIALKERQNRRISLAVPTLNEEKTVGKIVMTIQRQLMQRYPLVDELIVIDSQSEDRTVEIVRDLGIPVYQHPEILPQYGSFRGKGEALWKSLYVTTGDIIAWVDSDITGFTAKFIYGLLGPLLSQQHLGFVKGFYRRPLNLGNQRLTTGGGRVTELTARPLFNLFYPELSGLVQPLAGEMAGHRDVLASIPFFTGYGVETGLLIDILDRFGLRAIAQTDLEERIHRNQSLLSLSKMAFAIVQVAVQRLSERDRLALRDEMNTSMKLIHYSPSELFLEVKEIEEHERPPMLSIPEYVARHGCGARDGSALPVVSEDLLVAQGEARG